MKKLKLRKGDRVQVISGDDRGRDGEVIGFAKNKERVLVRGLNMQKKHKKPTANDPNGSIVDMEGSIHISNLAIMEDGKAVRVGYKMNEEGKKIRYSKKTGNQI